MKYVQRNKDGEVVACYDAPQVGQEQEKDASGNGVLKDGEPVLVTVDYAPEQLADDHPDVLAWQRAQAPKAYVRRDASGNITEVYRQPQEASDDKPATEAIDADHPELRARDRAGELQQERSAIDTARAAALMGGVSWKGKRYHLDNVFQMHLTGIITAFNAGILTAGATVAIRTFDNEVVQLGLEDLKGLAGTVLVTVQAIYQRSWSDKDALTT